MATTSITRLSVYHESVKEAARHKWIESQKRGRDVGDSAIREWYQFYWLEYCRQKNLEHVQGQQLWIEFAEEDFGCVFTLLEQNDLLLDMILDRVRCGWENLDVIVWAQDWGLDLDQVLCILEQLNINRARMEPRVPAYR